MASAAVAGLDCKIYRNTGTYASPTWNEITIAKDVSVPITKDKADASHRGSKWKMYLPAHKDATIDFDLIADTEIDDYDALRDAFTDDTVIDLAVADGAIATTKTQYFRAQCYIFAFSGDQAMSDAASTTVSAAPAYVTSNYPDFTEVA